jgi:hypothetical protein
MPLDPKDFEVFVVPSGSASIFNGGLDPSAWLHEKTLSVLKHAARAIDILNTRDRGEADFPLRAELHTLLWNALKLASFHVAHSDSPEAWSPELHADFMARGLAAFDDWKRRWKA